VANHRRGLNRRLGRRAGVPGAPAALYPRTARVNHVVQEVIAEELERLADVDERLRLVTVTGVETDPDLRHATVWVGSITAEVAEGLAEKRVRLQAAIASQVRLKRTPLLTFRADPAVIAASRVDEILRDLGDPSDQHDDGSG
jgi:ribosome-binding factor A